MAFYISGPQNDDFEPAPAGTHQGVCCDVVDLGVNEVNYQGKVSFKHQCRIFWQINETMEDGKRFIVTKKYNISLSPKATLRKDLKAWRGRDFTAEELQKFDLESVINTNCMLAVSHNTADDGRTFANVDTISPLMKGLSKMQVADDYVRKCKRPGWVEPSHEIPRQSGGDGQNGAAPKAYPQQVGGAPKPAGKHPLDEGEDGLPF